MSLSEAGKGHPRRPASSRALLPQFPAPHIAAAAWGGQEGRGVDVHGAIVTAKPGELGDT